MAQSGKGVRDLVRPRAHCRSRTGVCRIPGYGELGWSMDTLESIPPPFIALYAAVILALLVWSYVSTTGALLHKAAVADKETDTSEISG